MYSLLSEDEEKNEEVNLEFQSDEAKELFLKSVPKYILQGSENASQNSL